MDEATLAALVVRAVAHLLEQDAMCRQQKDEQKRQDAAWIIKDLVKLRPSGRRYKRFGRRRPTGFVFNV